MLTNGQKVDWLDSDNINCYEKFSTSVCEHLITASPSVKVCDTAEHDEVFLKKESVVPFTHK